MPEFSKETHTVQSLKAEANATPPSQMEAGMKELLKELKSVIVSRLIASSNGRLKRPKEDELGHPSGTRR
jgi:hypothetical protein